ncbi:MAG: DUF1178 family protein [Burkholderiales bacterium]|nr:DUF1178 family protein [Burkholderiales bacterium]
MIVFELVCPKHHRFEGWFASAEDFGSQKRSGLLCCPTCGATQIEKLPMARIGRQEAGPAAPAPASERPAENPGPRPAAVAFTPEKLNRLIDYLLANTDNVGPDFAAEARRIHNEEAPRRDIRGTASKEETEQLLEEGIPVLPLPIPRREDWH